MNQQSTYNRAIEALKTRAEEISDAPRERGRTIELQDNLVPGLSDVQIQQIRHQLGGGDGDELTPGKDGLPPKAHAAHSSAALAASAFGRWFGHEQDLAIAGLHGFDDLRLEAKQSIGMRGKPPNLDCLLAGRGVVAGVESKLTEYLADHKPKPWRPVYSQERCLQLLEGGWRKTLEDATEGRFSTRRLQSDQLLKHALGLAKQNPHVNLHLIYVYWEPLDRDEFEEFEEHRDELEEFAKRVSGPGPQFHALSYGHLLADWESQTDRVEWLGEHIAQLRRRYAISIA